MADDDLEIEQCVCKGYSKTTSPLITRSPALSASDDDDEEGEQISGSSAAMHGSFADEIEDERSREVEVTLVKSEEKTTIIRPAPIIPTLVVASPTFCLRIPYVHRSVNIVYSWKLRMADYARGTFVSSVTPSEPAIKKIISIMGSGTRPAFIPSEVQVVSTYNDSPYTFVVSCGKWIKSTLPRYVTLGGKVGNFELLPDKTIYDFSTGGQPIFCRTEDETHRIVKLIDELPTGFIGIPKEDIEKGVKYRAESQDYYIPKDCSMWCVISSMTAHQDLEATADKTGSFIFPASAYGDLKPKVYAQVAALHEMTKNIKTMPAKISFVTDSFASTDSSKFVDSTIAAFGVTSEEKSVLMNTTYRIQATLLVSGWFFKDSIQ